MKKIKFISLVLSVILCATFFTACQKQQTEVEKEDYKVNEPLEENDEKDTALDVFPMDMIFSSGAGGWRTQITLKDDGTFVGDYYDSEMGIPAADYDYTAYVCEFSGKYEIKDKIDDYSYSFEFTEVNQEKEMGIEWVEDRIRYIYSYPYGINEGNEYILYTDKTPLNGLDEELLNWWPHRYNYQEENIDTLMCYGLYDKKEKTAFFQLNY